MVDIRDPVKLIEQTICDCRKTDDDSLMLAEELWKRLRQLLVQQVSGGLLKSWDKGHKTKREQGSPKGGFCVEAEKVLRLRN